MRYTFGGGLSDFAIAPPSANASAVKAVANLTGGTFWSAAVGGTQYTDIIATGTDPTPVTTDANGFIRPFQGPDGVQRGWVDFGGGQRRFVTSQEGVSDASNLTTGVLNAARIPDLSGTYARVLGGVMQSASKADGTDQTSVITNELASLNTFGGGTLQLPGGTIRCDGQIVLPNNGATSGVPKQTAMALRGATSSWDGGNNGTITSGTVLDLRYSGADAKIVTTGSGLLRLEGMTLTDNGTSTTPYLLTTNTTVQAVGVRFLGNPTKQGTTCDQDAIIFGGTTTTIGVGTSAAFQGYGSVIERCQFDRMRRALYGRVYCNSTTFRGNHISVNCGSADTTPAVELDGTTGFAQGNIITGNLIEVSNYQYAITLRNSKSNILGSNAFWDAQAGLVALHRLVGSASGNRIEAMYADAVQAKWVEDNGNAYGLTSGYLNAGHVQFSGGADKVWVQPAAAQPSANSLLFKVLRATAESTNPSQVVFSVANDGTTGVAGTLTAAGQLSIGSSGVVKASGFLNLYAGSASSFIEATRGHFKVSSGATASRPNVSGTPGAHFFDTTLNKPVWSDGLASGSGRWRDARGYVTNLQTQTGNYTMVDGDEIVVANGATVTVTLPDPTTVSLGKRFTVKNINAAAATVVSAGTSKTIDGAASQSLAQWAKGDYVSDGTQWLTI